MSDTYYLVAKDQPPRTFPETDLKPGDYIRVGGDMPLKPKEEPHGRPDQ